MVCGNHRKEDTDVDMHSGDSNILGGRADAVEALLNEDRVLRSAFTEGLALFALAASHDASGKLHAATGGLAAASAEQLAKELEAHVTKRYHQVHSHCTSPLRGCSLAGLAFRRQN